MQISNVFRIFVLMNEQVTDISQVFNRLTSEMASMREVMDAMHTENVNLRRTVKKLRAENRTLRKRGNQIVFGCNIRAIVTYLNVVQCIPYERLASLMTEIFSVHMSQGTIRNIVHEGMRKSKLAISLLEEMLKKSAVVGFDESGCYNNKKPSQLNMSYPAFIRHFRKVFKDTPQEWLSKNRMKRLRDLLCNTAHTEQEIADELCFSTVQNMRAFCKARCGQTPAQLRDQ